MEKKREKQTGREKPPIDEKRMSLVEHLEELRRCLIVCAVGVGIGFMASYYFAESMFAALMAPLVRVLPPNSSLIFTGVTEAFFTYMKVAFLAGVFVSSPLIFYETWSFVSPGLYAHEKRYVIPFVAFSALCFMGGALFGYFVVFPYGFKFLMGFASEYIRPFPTVREYFSLASKLLFAFGAIFELPLVVFFLARMGLVTSGLMVRQFKYAFLLIFVTAAILTPTPDVVNQCLMAIPLLGLYGISIIVAFVFGKKAPKGETG